MIIPPIRIPFPREIEQLSKKNETTTYYRHCVASFEQFYLFLLKCLVMEKNNIPLTYAKWKECVSYFDDLQGRYFPFVKKHYCQYIKYYKKLCHYYSGTKQLLDLLRAQSYRYMTTYVAPSQNQKEEYDYDW